MDIEKDAEATQPPNKSPKIGFAYVVHGPSDMAPAEVDLPVLSSRAQSILNDVRENTGFESYHAYLQFHEQNYPCLDMLSSPPVVHRNGAWAATVLNLSNHGNISISEHLHAVEALCHPPDDAELQIVWCNMPINCFNVTVLSRWERETLDFFGLGYELDPRLFKPNFLHANTKEKGLKSLVDRYHPNYATAGEVLLTTCHSRLQGLETPIVLVFGQVHAEFQNSWCDLVEILPPPPFLSISPNKYPGGLGPAFIYQALLADLLDQNRRLGKDTTSLALVKLLRWRRKCASNRVLIVTGYEGLGTKLDRDEDSEAEAISLYECRALLRRCIDDMENDWWSLVRYIRSQHGTDWFTGQLYRNFEGEFREAVADVSRVECQIRDHLQLEAGKLGLEESRKSIEMSNRQIEEAKRVKLFTILAFVYIPLNLATSIFGMNIQQLNGSGKPLGDFITTAFLAVAITGGIWYVIEQLNSYRRWQKTRDSVARSGSRVKHSAIERMNMIFWLLRQRHWAWMRETGAWWRILFDDREHIRFPIHNTDLVMTRQSAADYVFKYSQLTRDFKGNLIKDYAFGTETQDSPGITRISRSSIEDPPASREEARNTSRHSTSSNY